MPTDSENASNLLFFDGEFVPNTEPTLSPRDQAIVLGQGIFETLIAYRNRIFRPDRHYSRLRAGANAMGLKLVEEDKLYEAMLETIAKNHLQETDRVRVRVTVTGGISDLRFGGDSDSPTVTIETSAAPQVKSTAKTITLPFARNEKGALAGLKTINYGENVVAIRTAREKGADEGIFGNTVGDLCEGTWSNIFVNYDGRWITPTLNSGCLPGVTRECVLEIAREVGIEISEADIPLSKLAEVENAFLTSTLREIQPISHIDGRELSEPFSQEATVMAEKFRELALSVV